MPNNRQEQGVAYNLDEMTPEQRLNLRLKWGKAVEDLTLAASDYVFLADEITLNGRGPYVFTDQEERNLSEFESFLRGVRTHIDAAIAVKLRFEKSLEGPQTIAQEPQASEEGHDNEQRLRDRLEWGKKLEGLIIALDEFHEAECKLYGEGPHAFTKVEADTLDEFNYEIAGAETRLSELMALKLRFEREHNL